MYDFTRLQYRVWPIMLLGEVMGWNAKYTASARDMFNFNVRESPTFGGIGRSKQAAELQAQYWRSQHETAEDKER